MFRYCPSCASPNARFEDNKKVYCPDCGLVYYHNTAAATGCIIRAGDGRVLFLVRDREPAGGKLDLPGGFVDPGEGALEGLRREIREEIGLDTSPFPDARFEFLCSLPNTYPFAGFVYNTCDLFFVLDAPDLQESFLSLEKEEIRAARFLRPEEILPGDLAFASGRAALKIYLEKYRRG